MQLTEEARIKLVIDGQEAANYVGQLSGKIDDLKSKQGELGKRTKENASEYDALKKEINGLQKEYDDLTGKMNVNEMTVKQLEKYQRELLKATKDLVPGTEEYIASAARLKEVNGRLTELRTDFKAVNETVNGSVGVWDSLKGWILGAFSVAAIVEFGQRLFGFLGDSVGEFKKFETAAQNLKGETQMTGDTLAYFKKQAVESGEAFGKTGDEMLQAYNAIASGKSDLLENREALKAVTDEAIRLSLAGEMDVPEAAKVMVESLNQFGAGADSAAKYVDILATGTIVGAGKINEIGAALKYVGPVANAAGLSFGETNSALQILHQNGIKGEQAGTALRGTLAMLMKGADDTNPSIVGLDVAFENLSKKNLTAKDALKLFGTENVSAGLALTNNNKTLKEWTEKIEAGGGAASMLADKTNTVAFKMTQAEAAMINQKVVIGQQLAPLWVDLLGLFINKGIPAIQGIATAFITVVNILKETPKFIIDNKELFIALGVALVSLNFGMIAATASTIYYNAVSKAQAIYTAAAASAQAGLNFVMSVNPIGAVIALIAGLIGGLIYLYNNFESVRAVTKALWEGLKSFGVLVFDIYKALLTLDFATFFDKIKNGFRDVGRDAMKGYNDELAKGHKVSEDDAKKSLNTKATNEKNTNEDLKNHGVKTNAEGNAKKAEDNKKYRDEQVAANKDMLAKIDDAWAKSLKDELASKKAQLLQKYEAEIANVNKSKASESVKATYTKVLNQNLINDLNDLENRYTKLKITNLDTISAKEFVTVDASAKMNESLFNRVVNWEGEKERANTRRQFQELAEEQKKMQAIEMLMQGDLVGYANAMGKKLSETTKFKLAAVQTYVEFFQKVAGFVSDNIGKFADAANAIIDIVKMRGQTELNIIEKGKQEETKAVRSELKKQEDAIVDLDTAIAKLEKEKYFEKDEKRKADLQKQIDNLTKEREAIVIQKNATGAELSKIEKDYDNKTRDLKIAAWEREKKLNIATAIINGIVGFVKALGSSFPPVNFAMAALVGVATAAQVAKIRSEPMPQFADGTFQPMSDSGYFQNAGVLGGLRHNTPEGGNWVINPRNGKLLAKVEEGEFLGVFSRQMTKRHGNLLRQLANSSINKTGKPIYAEDGYLGTVDGEGVPANAQAASDNAVQAGEDLKNINANTAETVKAVMDATGVLDRLGGILSDIAESSRRNADKPPVSIRQVISESNNLNEVVSASTFG
jgi:TP901 family phage tail tape measure protein